MTAPQSTRQPDRQQVTLGRALIVDDDVALCNALARHVHRLGYEVVTAYTAADGRGCIQSADFDVGLFDLQLPDASGRDLLVAFKQHAPESDAIVLTAAGSLEVALEAIHNGAFDFIPKPFTFDQLERALVRVAEQRKLKDLTALYRASHAIFATGDVEKLPEIIVEVAMRAMSADSVSLLLPGIPGELYLAHSYGLNPDVAKGVRVKIGEGVAGKVAASRVPVVIQGDARGEARFNGVTNANNAKSSIVYPLVSDQRLLGMLTFNRVSAARPFRQHDLEKAGVLASQTLLSLETTRLIRQNLTNEKLVAVGQLAAGITHEINTPIQFIGDSLSFLKRATCDIVGVIDQYRALAAGAAEVPSLASLAAEIASTETELDLAYSLEQMSPAVARALDGIGRVAEIVRAMKAFAHPDRKDKALASVNDILTNALVLGRNECKYVADIVTELDELPSVTCHAGEIGQVFLVLIVNAAHAIGETQAVADGGKGTISVKTSRDGDDHVLVSIADTGNGIPVEIRDRIFEPFFTTKDVGKGTGLGLPIARAIVVEKHGGSLAFSTDVGRGTTFFVRLPIETSEGSASS